MKALLKSFIIKYLYLSYTSKLFGRSFTYLRATPMIVPALALAILATAFGWGFAFWIPFIAFILLTFPILKEKYINRAALAVTTFIVITSFWYKHNWFEGLPFLYFALGYLTDSTRFLFPVKYNEIQDWEQQFQYLTKPTTQKKKDNTEPTGLVRNNLVIKLADRVEEKYAVKNINVKRLLITSACVLLLIIVVIIFGMEAYADRRFF